MKCQKGPPPERIVKTTVAPLSEAARCGTGKLEQDETGNGSGGPCRLCRWRHDDVERAALVGGGTLTWQVRAGFPRSRVVTRFYPRVLALNGADSESAG